MCAVVGAVVGPDVDSRIVYQKGLPRLIEPNWLMMRGSPV